MTAEFVIPIVITSKAQTRLLWRAKTKHGFLTLRQIGVEFILWNSRARAAMLLDMATAAHLSRCYG